MRYATIYYAPPVLLPLLDRPNHDNHNDHDDHDASSVCSVRCSTTKAARIFVRRLHAIRKYHRSLCDPNSHAVRMAAVHEKRRRPTDVRVVASPPKPFHEGHTDLASLAWTSMCSSTGGEVIHTFERNFHSARAAPMHRSVCKTRRASVPKVNPCPRISAALGSDCA